MVLLYFPWEQPPLQPLQLPEHALPWGQPMHFCPDFFAL